MASRVRVAASACLIASGLFIAGAGGAIALADPAQGNGHSGSDHRKGEESKSDNARRAGDLGAGGESELKIFDARKTRWGNGRQGEKSDAGAPPKDTPTCTRPCPDHEGLPPGQTPSSPESAGGGGSGLAELPRYMPPQIFDMQLPDDLIRGAAAVAPIGPAAPIAVPVTLAPPVGLGVGAGAAPGPPPANVAGNPANSSFRMGYSQYLRNGALPQVAALALPGLVGIVVLAGVGGLMGYRQARAGHAVRVSGSARFMR